MLENVDYQNVNKFVKTVIVYYKQLREMKQWYYKNNGLKNMYWYKNHPESSTPHNNNTNTLSHKNILSYYD